jgi:hypothetical protein
LPPPHAETDPKEIVEDCVYDFGCGYGNACSHSASGTKITPGLTAQAYSPGGGKRIRTVGPSL